MYRRPRFLEILIAIREEMARDADFDVDLFVEMIRSGRGFERSDRHAIAEQAVSVNSRASRRIMTKKK
jgi:hypothetical protein